MTAKLISDFIQAIEDRTEELENPRLVVSQVALPETANLQVLFTRFVNRLEEQQFGGKNKWLGFLFSYLEDLFAEDPPNSVSFRLDSRVVGPPAGADMTARLVLDPGENLGLVERVEAITPVPGFDVLFSIPFTARFQKLEQPIDRIMLRLKVDGGPESLAKEQVLQIQIPTFRWFLEYAAYAPETGPSRDMLARTRKALLPNKNFDVVIGQYRDMPDLFDDHPSMCLPFRAGSRRLRAADTVLNVSHALVGIEGGREQNPQPHFKYTGLAEALRYFVDAAEQTLARIETLVTWGGDCCKPVSQMVMYNYLRQLYPGAIFSDPSVMKCFDAPTDAQRMACLLEKSAGPEDLVGDVDGVNLMPVFDPDRTLVEQLQAYYQGDNNPSRRRYRLFVNTRQRKLDGQPALAMYPEPGGARWRLAAGSVNWVKQEISIEAVGFTAIMLYQDTGNQKPLRYGQVPEIKRILETAEVQQALSPDSLLVLQATEHFVQWLEARYNEEVGPPPG